MPRALVLFSGTKSIEKGLWATGVDWECVSVDREAKFEPTHCVDVLTWDYTIYQPGDFDYVHSSTPCDQYSIARSKAKTPRNLELADGLALKSLEIIAYFRPAAWTIENPATSMLRRRDFMQGRRFHVVTYCSYNGLGGYQKLTAFWASDALLDAWKPRRLCRKDCPYSNGRRHFCTAQRGPAVGYQSDVSYDRSELYVIPAELCIELARAVNDVVLPRQGEDDELRGDAD